MRKALATMAAVLILASMSCSTTQPTSGGPQVITVTAAAFALVNVWQIWDIWADLSEPPDGVPDQATPNHQCVMQTEQISTNVPWPYSAEMTLIQVGSTNELRLGSTVTAPNPFSNITPYDTNVIRTLPDLQPSGVFYFLNGREVTAGTRDYIESCTSFASLFAASNILGEPVSFSAEVQQGDTVVFRARKQLDSFANPYASIANSDVVLTSSYFVDGRAVTPAGTTSVSSDGAGFTASVRIR